jgi:cytidylate kinase
MPVITISRQYGSGGSSIAQLLADRLGWVLIDNEFVDRVAERAGLSRQEVQAQEERVPSLMERLADALAISSPEVFVATGEPPATGLGTEERVVRATEAVIAQAVQEQGRLILVGRGAQACLAQRKDTLHVYIVAPRDARIEAAMKRLGMDRAAAQEYVDKTDDGRRRYVKTHYARRWDDAANYHLVLNTGAFTHEQCADLVVAAAAIRGWPGS